MARNVKKKSPEPQLCQPAEIFAALQMLEKERGIPVDYMVDRIKQALITAYRKDREDHREVPAENVEVELTEAVMSMVQQRTVVEEVENPASEISLDAARNTSPNAQPGRKRAPIQILIFRFQNGGNGEGARVTKAANPLLLHLADAGVAQEDTVHVKSQGQVRKAGGGKLVPVALQGGKSPTNGAPLLSVSREKRQDTQTGGL